MELLAHRLFEFVRRTTAVGFQNDEDIGPRMRHWIFAMFGATSAPNNVFDFGERPQSVFHAVIHAVHLVKRSFGRKNCLNQKGTLIELRHEVGADVTSEYKGWQCNHNRNGEHLSAMSQGEVEKRCIDTLQFPNEPYIFLVDTRLGP